MKRLAVLALCLSIMMACRQSLGEPERSLPRFEPIAAGDEFPARVPSTFNATLGWLVVAEDRSAPASSVIRLPVAIIHSRSGRLNDPVVYIAGGPGVSGLSAAAYPGAYPWLGARDFIVVGQRGTQDAMPALMCPEYRDALNAGRDSVTAARACRARLTARGIGVENYDSPASAADLEDLRQVLEIDAWNLYAASYGTRLALTYARTYGGSIRAMVLDSPLPPNAIYDDESAVNFESTLRAIASDCSAQPRCAEVYPDLEDRFFNRIEATTRSPISVEGVTEPVTGADLAALVSVSSGRDVINAPKVMDAIAGLEPDVLEALAAPWEASDFAWGMRLSVWCREALPFSKRSQRGDPEATLGGFESAAIKPEICAAWDVPPLETDFSAPVISDVPTLILAGEFDPLTPPAWGERAAETLSRSRVVSVRGEAHLPSQQWNGDGCAMSLAGAFIDAPETTLSAPSSGFCVFARAAPQYALKPN